MVPALEFLDDCPSTLDAQFTAVLDAVAAAPPPWFSGGGKWEAMQGTMDRVLQARLPGGARARPRTPEELPAPHRDLVAAIAGDQGTRIRQQDAKSQTKSQRPQTPSHARRLPATITAARRHVGLLPAPSRHATDFAYKRGVTGSNPVAPTKFSQLDANPEAAGEPTRPAATPAGGQGSRQASLTAGGRPVERGSALARSRPCLRFSDRRAP